MGGAVMQASDAVQSVAFTLPAASADVATRVGDFVRLPPTLLRYTLASSDVSVRLLGPT
jgi:hypothetical protein